MEGEREGLWEWALESSVAVKAFRFIQAVREGVGEVSVAAGRIRQ